MRSVHWICRYCDLAFIKDDGSCFICGRSWTVGCTPRHCAWCREGLPPWSERVEAALRLLRRIMADGPPIPHGPDVRQRLRERLDAISRRRAMYANDASPAPVAGVDPLTWAHREDISHGA